MSVQRVASAYAKSLVDLSKERNVLDTVYNDMVLVAKTCDGSKELRNLLASPIIAHVKKLNIIDSIFKGKISELSLSFFHLIIRKRRETLLFFIALEFIEEYKREKGIIPATLVTAVETDNALKEEIKKLIDPGKGKSLELISKVDPSLIGGFVLKTGSLQIDASVRSKLNKIKNQFSSTHSQ